MKCQRLFSGKNHKKNISNYRLLKILPSMLSVMHLTLCRLNHSGKISDNLHIFSLKILLYISFKLFPS